MNTPPNDRGLPGVLRAWHVSPAASSHFTTDVWRRIEAKRADQSWAGYAKGHAALLAALVMVAAFAGGWSGSETAQSRVEKQSASMADAYVQSMDARRMTMP